MKFVKKLRNVSLPPQPSVLPPPSLSLIFLFPLLMYTFIVAVGNVASVTLRMLIFVYSEYASNWGSVRPQMM